MKSLGLTSFALCFVVACSAPDGISEAGSTRSTEDLLGTATEDDGVPVRLPCKSTFGKTLTGSFGRLDGVVVAVVHPGHGACNADSHHVHLQVMSQGQVFDVAVNVDSGFFVEKDVKLPGEAWADGWHSGGSLDYPRDLGLRAADFTAASEPAVDSELEAALATANHISVFATTYNHGGIHLVHRQGNGHDGALAIDPLSAQARIFAFHFSNQQF